MTIRLSSVNEPVRDVLAFTEARLVLVEGKDDQEFLSGLLKSQGLDGFQIHSLGGKPSWRKKIGAIVKDPTFEDNVRVVGMFRDADNSPDDAWRSCVDSINAAGLPVPTDHAQLTNSGGREVGVVLLPGRTTPGALEELLIPALSSARLGCVASYQSCLDKKGEDTSKSSKATLQTYLAGLPEPARDLHVAIAAGHVNFRHESLAPIVRFLRSIASIN